MVVLATWVEGTFRARIHLAEYVPSFLAEPTYHAVYGFLVSVALVTRQLIWHQDPVSKAFEEIRPKLNGEMLELADQSVSLYVRIQKNLRDRQENGNQTEPNLEKAVETLVLRIFDMGRQWQKVEQGAGQTNADELVDRIAILEQKIERSNDEVASKQYRLACEALKTQLKYLKEISRNRERVTARAHNYLATLERLHLALWNHRGADTAKLSDEVQPILDEIDDIGHEMEYATEAIDEVSDVNEADHQADLQKENHLIAEASIARSSAPTPDLDEPKAETNQIAAKDLGPADEQGNNKESSDNKDDKKAVDPEADLTARMFE
jgi:hypothetical protein